MPHTPLLGPLYCSGASGPPRALLLRRVCSHWIGCNPLPKGPQRRASPWVQDLWSWARMPEKMPGALAPAPHTDTCPGEDSKMGI